MTCLTLHQNKNMSVKIKFNLLLVLFLLVFISCQGEENYSVRFENYGALPDNHLFFKNESLKFSEYLTFNNWRNSQGGAIYGDILLNVLACDEIEDGIDNAFMWDLKTGEKLASFNLGFEFEGTKYYKPHANVVCFGVEKTEKSKFPLLYVGQTFGLLYGQTDSKSSGIIVYELQENSGSYTPNVVQIIRPDITDDLLMQAMGPFIHNYVVDTGNKMLYSFNYEGESFWDASMEILVISFKLPELSDGKEVVLTNEKIVDKFTIPMAYCMQSMFYDNGFIYFMNGSHTDHKWIRSLNLKSQKIESKIDFTVIGGEPQFCGYWNGRFLIYFAGNGATLFEIRKD